MAYDSHNRLLYAITQDRTICIFNSDNGKQVKQIKYDTSAVTSTVDWSYLKISLSPNGHFAAVCCSDKSLRLIDISTGNCLAQCYGHSEVLTGACFTADMTRVISTSADGCIFVWRLNEELFGKIHGDQIQSTASTLPSLNVPISILSSPRTPKKFAIKRHTWFEVSMTDSCSCFIYIV
jgi:WD40 repeat protein